MHDEHQAKLEELGLSTVEAQTYLALLRNGGNLGARAVADAAGFTRTNAYPILDALIEKGLVEAEVGYGGRFSVVPPGRAFRCLIARKRDELSQCKRIAGDLVKQLGSLAKAVGNNGEVEQIQVLRDRRVFGERFERLQDEAKELIEVFIKSPILNPRYSNPRQEKAIRRGVRVRGLYERAIVNAPEIQPYLSKWIAGGESARVYDGQLPHKLSIFDRQSILIPLVPPTGQVGRILFAYIRHPQLAASLGMLFDFLWQRAKPIACETRNAGRKRSRNSDADDGNSERRSPTRARPSGRSRTI
jgi:sugar-specific transcriptional regulator TrmB